MKHHMEKPRDAWGKKAERVNYAGVMQKKKRESVKRIESSGFPRLWKTKSKNFGEKRRKRDAIPDTQ